MCATKHPSEHVVGVYTLGFGICIVLICFVLFCFVMFCIVLNCFVLVGIDGFVLCWVVVRVVVLFGLVL